MAILKSNIQCAHWRQSRRSPKPSTNHQRSRLSTLLPILLTLSLVCRQFVESRLSPARSKLLTMSPKLNMFNSVEFVESW